MYLTKQLSSSNQRKLTSVPSDKYVCMLLLSIYLNIKYMWLLGDFVKVYYRILLLQAKCDVYTQMPSVLHIIYHLKNNK